MISDNDKRLTETINTAMYHGENVLMVIEQDTTKLVILVEI